MQDDPIKEKLTYICKQFRIPGDILVYRWIPSGHINTAYYLSRRSIPTSSGNPSG